MAFRYTKWASARKWICYILTLFLLRLFFLWFPQLHIRFVMSSCRVGDADKFLIKDSAGVYYVVDVVTRSNNGKSNHLSTASDMPQFFTAVVSGEGNDNVYEAWIYYKNIKYTLDVYDGEYQVLP